MNYVEAQVRRTAIDGYAGVQNLVIQIGVIEDERDLYRDLLKACVEYLPDVDPHGVDKRAVEEALGNGRGNR